MNRLVNLQSMAARLRRGAMRNALLLVVAAISLVLFPAQSQAQAWPSRPIKVVVPYGPGSSPDVLPVWWANDWGSASASRCWSKIVLVQAAMSAPGLWRRRRPMVIPM